MDWYSLDAITGIENPPLLATLFDLFLPDGFRRTDSDSPSSLLLQGCRLRTDVSGGYLQHIWRYVHRWETVQLSLRPPGKGNGFYTELFAKRRASLPAILYRRHVPTLDALLAGCLFWPGIRPGDTHTVNDGS